MAAGDNAKITIELSGNAPGTSVHDTFAITAGGTTVRGLAINRFGGDAFAVSGGAGDTIAGDFVGTDPTGKIGEGNGTSEFESILVNASGLTIGGPATADRTIVSDSGFYGIRLLSGAGDVIENSYVGTDASGTVALPNYSFAIYVAGASNVTIGGTTAALRNVISGNRSSAIALISTGGNVVEGNYIGTDASGTIGLGNGSDGIVISVGGNTIGGDQAGAGNLISGNVGAGVLINYNGHFTRQRGRRGNLIGTDKSGTLPIPNDGAGVNIGNEGGGGYNNTIGGTTPAERSIISGNVHDGLDSSGTGSTNVIVGNYVGVDITGLVGLPNGGEGVDVYGSSDITIGGTAAGAGNVIAGNKLDGIFIFSPGVVVQGNLIGLGSDGLTRLGNYGDGINTYDDTLIGGTIAAARNAIAANGASGIALNGGAGMAVIEGNYIGTDATGLLPKGQ